MKFTTTTKGKEDPPQGSVQFEDFYGHDCYELFWKPSNIMQPMRRLSFHVNSLAYGCLVYFDDGSIKFFVYKTQNLPAYESLRTKEIKYF
jgi:hypothetical protein